MLIGWIVAIAHGLVEKKQTSRTDCSGNLVTSHCGEQSRTRLGLEIMPRVYIGRLSYHVREKDIQRFFSGYGKLMEIDLKNGWVFGGNADAG